jgi:hypothetical protein
MAMTFEDGERDETKRAKNILSSATIQVCEDLSLSWTEER